MFSHLLYYEINLDLGGTAVNNEGEKGSIPGRIELGNKYF